MVRCAVHSLLKEMNQSTLAKLSPLSQSAISNIANWKYSNTLSVDKCCEFGKWYKNYMQEKTDNLDFADESNSFKDMRLTFHPDHEIPQLREWYRKNKNPGDNKLYFYANDLNKGHVRQERPKVTLAKLKMWWKNERQREKRISAQNNSKMDQDVKSADIQSKNVSKSGKRLKSGMACKTKSTNQTISSSATDNYNRRNDLESELTAEHQRPAQSSSLFSTSQTPDSFPENSSVVSSEFHPIGFVSLLQNNSQGLAGNQIVLSDGTVVRTAPMIFSTTGNVHTENQTVSTQPVQVHTGAQLDVHYANVRNQSISRKPENTPCSQGAPGAPLDRGQLSRGHWNEGVQ